MGHKYQVNQLLTWHVHSKTGDSPDQFFQRQILHFGHGRGFWNARDCFKKEFKKITAVFVQHAYSFPGKHKFKILPSANVCKKFLVCQL